MDNNELYFFNGYHPVVAMNSYFIIFLEHTAVLHDIFVIYKWTLRRMEYDKSY